MEIELEIKSSVSKKQIQKFCDYLNANVEGLSDMQIKNKKSLSNQMGNIQDGIISGVIQEFTSKSVDAFIKKVWEPVIYPQILKGWNIIVKPTPASNTNGKKSRTNVAIKLELGVSIKDAQNQYYFFENKDGSRQIYDQVHYSINTEKTYAVVIGSSTYNNDFHDIPPVKNNLDDIIKLLSDKRSIGIPKKNITKIYNKRCDYIYEQVYNISMQSDIDTLIIYYAGHGYQVGAKKLFLATINSVVVDDNTIFNAIDYDFIRKTIIKKSQAKQKILILDSCHSGIAVQSKHNPIYDVEGSYVMASSAAEELSYFKTGGRNTYFTGAVLDSFKNGIDCTKEMISLNDIFENTRNILSAKKFPEPIQKRDLNIPPQNYFIALNPQYSFEKLKELPKLLFEKGKHNDASYELELLIKRFPDDEELKQTKSEFQSKIVYANLIENGNNSFYKDKDYLKAAEYYSKALKIKNDDTSIVENLKKCQLHIEDMGKLSSKDNALRENLNRILENLKTKFIHLFEDEEDVEL